MPVLAPKDRETVQQRFERELQRDVSLTLFTSRSAATLLVPGRECPTCPQTQELLVEVASLSPKLKLQVHDFYSEPETAQAMGVERIPCIVLGSDAETGGRLKFYGIPAGYEFVTLLEGVTALSKGTSLLQPSTREALGKLDTDVHIQVFVTPG